MNYKIPEIARGTVLPCSIQEKIAKQEQEKSVKNKMLNWLEANTLELIAIIISIIALLKQ